MKQKGKRTLTPKLRFPEFRDGEGWQTPQLSDLYGFKRTNTLSRDKLNYEAGTIRNIHYGDIHIKFKPLFRVENEYVPFINPEVSVDAFEEGDDCEEGDIILADASEDLNDVGKAIEVVSLDGQRVVAGTHTILATRHGSVPIVGFGGHLFQSPAVRAGIRRESQGAKVYGISANRISPVSLPIPPTNQEQQKIAECLGSLDGLIAAEGRKLAALRGHKRGLMQQLFPQPGETQPRLRFPEFHKGREWKSVKLSKVFEEYREKSTVQDQYEVLTSARRGLIRQKDYYGEGRITGRDNVGFNIIPPNYITYRSRADDRRFYFNENDLGITGIISTYYPVFRVVDGSNKFFIELLAHYQAAVGKYSVGTSQTVLSLPMLGRVKLPLPTPAEQQKIADCLTALDSLITAQAAKIETLKTHKRGLMQQLFPVPEGQ